MRYFMSILLLAIFTTPISCSSSGTGTEIVSNSQQSPVTPLGTSHTLPSIVKFNPFNNINSVRINLSSVGIGDLGRWRNDEMGGYISITSYHHFGGGNMPNNLAYYLESDNSNAIKTLKLVLNINNGNKKTALLKFAKTIERTYKALDLIQNSEIIKAAKTGKELKVDKETHIEKIELEKSLIETWKFIIETK